ncbi:winged helix-turn-helix domain-containing protein [Arthrobacter sp.]|uniref:ArsR/SmtB family transcription factor n=1 Tax=Arthrobacter sp. TaxID=1667 RepID=UPI0028113D38|nr:winged helix-turn-helix domain-containing protein [Arthrobacter sp.]
MNTPALGSELAAQAGSEKVEITDPKAIRALAHAARLEVISELYSTQVSRTATELAGQTGLTPSAMSYHLRALQKWGIVVPAETAGDARERRWRAAGSDVTINSGGSLAHPEFAVLDLELDAFRRRATAYAKSKVESTQSQPQPEDPPAGIEGPAAPTSVVLASNLLYLTVEQRRELNGRILELLRDYELKDPGLIPEQAERIATLWSMIPDDRPRAT